MKHYFGKGIIQMRNLRLISILLIAVLLAAGSVGATRAQDTVNITYWLAGGVGSAVSPEKQAIVDAFQKANPNIKVTVESIPFAEYDKKSQTVMTAKEGPDVLEVNSVTIGSFVKTGLLQPIDELVTPSDIKGEQFYPGAWASVNIKGNVWGLPLDTGTRLILWNEDLFKAAGLKPLGEKVTWEEILAAAKAINQPDKGIYGWGYAAGERWLSLYDGFGHFAIQNDAVFIDNDGNVTTDSPAMLETLKFYYDLTRYSPPDAMNFNTLAQIEQLFAAGKVGMYIAGWWSMDGAIEANKDLKFGITIPGRKVYGSSTGGWIVSIPAHVEGAKRDAAWKLMQFIFEPKNNATWTSLVPNQPKAPTDKLADKRYKLYLEVLKDSRHPLPLIAELPSLADALQVHIQKMLLGQTSPEETQKNMTQEFKDILSK
jgi:multiple sugar transport system substrate-binding protein